MNITVFTSNQPRHINLINALSTMCDRVYAIQECNTVFPGEVKDFFNNSQVMSTYFSFWGYKVFLSQCSSPFFKKR